jgi:hypothetical protein
MEMSRWEQNLIDIYIMSKMSSKTKTVTYQVEGPDWVHTVMVEADIFETEQERLFEAGTRAIEKEMKSPNTFNIGALLIIRKGKSSKNERLVNSYICLNNAALYNIAEDLRKNFKAQTGQDIATDTTGISD